MHQTFELVAIQDPADSGRRLLIRAFDFNPAIHSPWVVVAATADVSDLQAIEPGTHTPPHDAAPVRRGPGRPRKVAA